MGFRDIIVIGGSAGCVEAGRRLVRGLPRDLSAAIFFVLHVPPYAPSALPAILSAAGPLEAHHANDCESIRSGRIYVAPPDHHMMIEQGHVLVRRGPKENRARPSIDALFRSAAYGYGPRVIGVLLSGILDDGVSGLWSIKRLGGVTIVQDPADAEHSQMPLNALEQVEIDHVSTAEKLGGSWRRSRASRSETAQTSRTPSCSASVGKSTSRRRAEHSTKASRTGVTSRRSRARTVTAPS